MDVSEAELIQARECYRRREWSEAHRLLLLADRKTPLGVEDLERLAASAYLVGRDLDFHRFLDRAHHAHARDGDALRAARCAFWLALTLLLRGETGQSNGWLARGRRLVEGRDCVEQGYLLLPVAEQHLVERNREAAVVAASAAIEVGDRFDDADLTTCARHVLGRAIMEQGELERGLGLLDEAMIAVSGGELTPIITGLIYCSVIDAYQQVFALSRAWEWTVALTRWREQQPEMVAFTGICLVHRAEIMQFHGAWGEALAEACHAGERASGATGQPRAAAFYRQGEIHRLRGQFRAAEEAYRNASRLGLEPQPGLALLRMAQGRTESAAAAVRRILGATTDRLQRAKLLPAYTEIALAAGDVQEARSAAAELGDIAGRYPTDILQAMAARAQGAVELVEGRTQIALRTLRHAFELWQHSEAPYETARVRLLLALACRELADVESADLEFDAARAIFEQLGAAPDVAHLDSLRYPARQPNQYGLTPRELQVLRQVAAGKTNKAIAVELFVSERTIDRHMSNIFTKLGVTSRAAATACAYNHKLL